MNNLADKKNKVTAQPAAQRLKKQNGARQIADNRPLSVTQKKQADAMAGRGGKQLPLQKKINTAGEKGNPVVQRYTIVQPGNLRAQKDATIETQDIARTNYGSTYTKSSIKATQQGINPTASTTTTEKVSGAVQQAPSALPPFKVSQNGYMAIADHGQAKSFYVDAARVNQANNVLRDSGAKVRLKTGGHGITVPQNPAMPNPHQTRNLKKAQAALEVTNAVTHLVETQVQNILPDVQCNDFIRLVTGASAQASRVAVLEQPGQPLTHVEVSAEENREPVKEIATHLSAAGAPKNTGQINGDLAGPALSTPQKNAGMRSYENLTDPQRDQRSQLLGINEYVNPQVGEGMVIRSLETNNSIGAHHGQASQIVPAGTNSKKKKRKLRQNYSQAIQDLAAANAVLNNSRAGVSARVQLMMKTWGEHYAGVVGRDGPDMVTLENYNRVTEVRWEHERIFNNLFRDFQEFRNLVSDRVDHLYVAPDENTIQQLVQIAALVPGLSIAYQAALAEATQSFQTGLQQTQQTYQGAFYFSMYGPAAQSFHAQFKGMASNPVTLHIKENLLPVQQSATTEIQDLHNLIARWEVPILANPVNGFGVQAGLVATINHARGVEVQANIDFAAANTRGEYAAVASAASNESWNVFNQTIRQGVMNAFQAITGHAPVPAANDLNDLVARCTTFLGTYRFYHRADAPYNNITHLRAMAQALIAAGL
jgi:hypothetical protein